jgi:hypothetical protein
MKLKGILDFSLGNFLCLRGFAPMGVLQSISKPDENIQRVPKDERLREIGEYLKKGDFLFFPEVILCVALNDTDKEMQEVNELWEAVKQGRPARIKRFAHGLRISSVVSKSKKPEDIRAVRFYQTGTMQFNEADGVMFSRIDGNHRLAATTDAQVRDRITPFCIVFCRNPTEFRRFSSALFHNINYKQVPLPKEHNLRLILEDTDLFPDEKLKSDPSFGWSYYLARRLRNHCDFDLLPNLKPLIENEPYSFLVDHLEFLLRNGVLGDNEHAIQRFKKAISEVNAVFQNHPALRDSTNRGLLAALTYYQLKSTRTVSSFVRWIIDNNIYLIADSSTPDLISIYDKILESRKRTIFVSMPFGKTKSDEHYAIIEKVAEELSEKHDLKPPLKVERVDLDNDGTSADIATKIFRMIDECGLLIGNLTYCNPNVYHEIGFIMGKAKAEGKNGANMLLFLDESAADNEKFVGFNLRGIKQLRFTKPVSEFAPALRNNLEKFFALKG